MAYDFEHDDEYKSIFMEINNNDGLFKDAWIEISNEKWYPSLVTERSTGIRGFYVKPNSTRGKAEKIGRKKIDLKYFLILLSTMTPSSTEQVRCQIIKSGQKNSKPISHLKFSKRLQDFLTRVKKI